MTIYTNAHSKKFEEIKWFVELFIHPTSWALPLEITIRWDDIYSVTFLCLSIHFSKNEFYGKS